MSSALYYSRVFTFKFMAPCPGGSMVGWSRLCGQLNTQQKKTVAQMPRQEEEETIVQESTSKTK